MKVIRLWGVTLLFIRKDDLAVSYNLIDWYHWISGTQAENADKGIITFSLRECMKIARACEDL